MDIGKIIGHIVATRNVSSLEGCKICIVQPLDADLNPQGPPLVATDAMAARDYGEIVYYVTSGDAVYTKPDGSALPIDAAIMGIVDQLFIDETARKKIPKK